jgi:hypothetical protein
MAAPVNSAPDPYIHSQMNTISSHIPRNLPPGMSIVFINGVFNSCLDSLQTAVCISTSIGSNEVTSVHNNSFEVNPTVERVVQKIIEQFNRCSDEVTRLALTVDKVRVVLIAHSHGAAILEKALRDLRLNSMKEKFEIITMGGAALIPFAGYKSARNLINDFDFVPLVAHNSFDHLVKAWEKESNWSIEEWLTKGPLYAAILIKNKGAEEVLQISSHENPVLARAIFEYTDEKWESYSATSLIVTFVREIMRKIFSEPYKLDTPLAPAVHFGMLFVTPHIYKIEILERPSMSSESISINAFFNHYHSVNAYTDKLSSILSELISEPTQNVNSTRTA